MNNLFLCLLVLTFPTGCQSECETITKELELDSYYVTSKKIDRGTKVKSNYFFTMTSGLTSTTTVTIGLGFGGGVSFNVMNLKLFDTNTYEYIQE